MPSPERRRELHARARELEWFHRIDLGGGFVTAGRDDSVGKLRRIRLPTRLDGLRVLDVGAWDGFFSFEAERRGAAVVALDWWAWQRGPGSGRPCFELAREALDSKVEDVSCEVMDISPERIGTFDLVLCLGVLYHLRDPLGALERIASVTRERLILETHFDAAWTSRPVMVLYPGGELNDDPSNWWGPNPRALRAMLEDVGFGGHEVVYRTPFPRRLARAIVRTGRARFGSSLLQGRIAIHATRGTPAVTSA